MLKLRNVPACVLSVKQPVRQSVLNVPAAALKRRPQRKLLNVLKLRNVPACVLSVKQLVKQSVLNVPVAARKKD